MNATVTAPDHSPTARLVDWTPEQYHESTRVSNSRLKDFRESRRRYHATHVTRTLAAREQTPAMLLGSLVDDLLFLPDAKRFAVAPRCDRRTNAGKAEWASFSAAAAAAGQYVVPGDVHETAQAMVASLLASPYARDLLTLAGPGQAPIIWDDEETGMPCRALLDKLVPELGLVVDLKTTTDLRPEKWSKKILDFEYHCQAAWYLDAAIRLTGTPHGFAHVVISTVAPYEVAVYELEMRAIELGAARNRDALAALAKCLETECWLAPYEQAPMVVGLPHWAYPREVL